MVKHKKINFPVSWNCFQEIIFEIIFGFFMAITTFKMLPIAIENSGFIIVFFGVITGVFFFIISKHFLKKRRFIWALLCFVMLLIYCLIGLPFSKYSLNGLLLGFMAGILLSVQILYLSEKNDSHRQPKYLDIMYLFGLLSGIILK